MVGARRKGGAEVEPSNRGDRAHPNEGTPPLREGAQSEAKAEEWEVGRGTAKADIFHRQTSRTLGKGVRRRSDRNLPGNGPDVTGPRGPRHHSGRPDDKSRTAAPRKGL